MKRLLLFLLLCLILCSCDPDLAPEPFIGSCSNPPRLSKEKLSFSAEGGIDTVVVGNTHWWLNEVYQGNESYQGCKNIGPENEGYCNDNYCNNDRTMKIECSWFSVTRINGYTLLVSVNGNNTNEEKNTSIGVQDGNCHSGFSIVQAPKFPREELLFNAKGGIDSVTTEGEWHRISEPLMIEDTAWIYVTDKRLCNRVQFPFLCTDGIPFIVNESGIVGIEHSWFTVDKQDKKKIIFSVSENITGRTRKFGIRLEAEEYYTYVWVNQYSE
ncbi:MAG: hypothetical protein LBC64_05900 [Fibromonadaceae bacterium]|jgi:hypothetical protein|nr:hypothetical protein [Fibromonadaceae bacterium]